MAGRDPGPITVTIMVPLCSGSLSNFPARQIRKMHLNAMRSIVQPFDAKILVSKQISEGPI
jgi:hypothetical protein